MTAPRATRLILTALPFIAAVGLAGCSANEDVAVLDTALLTWPGDDVATDGQVIVTIRNDGEAPIDPDVLGSGRLTLAHLLDREGEDLPGGDARVQLHAVPHVVEPGETGYLIGGFEINETADRIDDARVEVNAGRADARAPVRVEGFELVDGADGVGATGRLEWDGAGTAVARAIALDGDGRPVGYMATSEVLYTPGEFIMCCFPPTVGLDSVEDVLVFGDQAREEN